MLIDDRIIQKMRNCISSKSMSFLRKCGLDSSDGAAIKDIVSVICDFYNGNYHKIRTLSIEDREDVLEAIGRECGIIVPQSAYQSLRTLISYLLSITFKGYDDADRIKVNPVMIFGQFSFSDYIALNSYDFQRLIYEINNICTHEGVAAGNLSPTLNKIIDETNAPDALPGRLSYMDVYDTKTTKVYKRLRLLDEIFVENNDRYLSIQEIYNELKNKSGKDFRNLWRRDALIVSENEEDIRRLLHDDFLALAEMIAVDPNHTHGNKRDEVFEFHYGARKYRMGVAAFKTVIKDVEARAIYNEISRIIPTFFKDMLFRYRYPLTQAIGLYGKSMESNNLPSRMIEGKYVKFSLLDYYPMEMEEAESTIRKALEERQVISVNRGRGVWKTYMPVSLRRREGGRWTLVAVDCANRTYETLSPRMFRRGVTLMPERFDIDFDENLLVGLSAPLFPEPQDIKIHTNLSTKKRLYAKYGNKICQDWDNEEIYSSHKWSDKQEILTMGVLSLRIYVNNDFFNDLYAFKDKGYIKSISPHLVEEAFDNYCRCQEVGSIE